VYIVELLNCLIIGDAVLQQFNNITIQQFFFPQTYGTSTTLPAVHWKSQLTFGSAPGAACPTA
jgi:hypothetical protein